MENLNQNREMKQYRYRVILPLVVTALALASCAVTKEYSRTEDIVSDNIYRDSVEESSKENTIANREWRVYFSDKLLQDHITTALKNNSSCRLAVQQILKAKARLKQSKAGYMPTLSVNASAGTTSVNSGNIDSYGLTGTASWEADIWGKIQSGVDASKVYEQITEVEYAGVRATLIADISTLYIDLLAADKQLEITIGNSELQREQISTLQALKEAGVVNQVSIEQAKAQLSQVEGQIEIIKKGINEIENGISILMGVSSQEIERSTIDQFNMDRSYATGVPASLLEYRPDVKSAELEMIRTLELTNVSKAQFYPSLSISATGGFEALKFASWITPESALFNIVGSLTQPILNRRALKTEYELAQLAEQDALIMFEQSLLLAGKEVSDALFAIESIDKQSIHMKSNLEANRRAVAISEELLNYGEVTYLDLLTAQQNLLTAELSLAMLQSSYYTSRVALYRALGGGVK